MRKGQFETSNNTLSIVGLAKFATKMDPIIHLRTLSAISQLSQLAIAVKVVVGNDYILRPTSLNPQLIIDSISKFCQLGTDSIWVVTSRIMSLGPFHDDHFLKTRVPF